MTEQVHVVMEDEAFRKMLLDLYASEEDKISLQRQIGSRSVSVEETSDVEPRIKTIEQPKEV